MFLDAVLERFCNRLVKFSYWMPFLERCLKLLVTISDREMIEIDKNRTFFNVFFERCLKRLDNFSARKMIEI